MKQRMNMIKILCMKFLHIDKSFAKMHTSSKGKNAQNDRHRQKGTVQLQMSSKHAIHVISMNFSCGFRPDKTSQSSPGGNMAFLSYRF